MNEVMVEVMVIVGAFLSFIALVALFFIIKPEIPVRWTVRYYTGYFKMLGFECDIKPTPRAFTICRIYHVVLFFFIVVGFILIVFTKK